MPAAALAMSRSGGRATDDVGPQHVHVVGVLGEESTELADRLLLYAAFERRGFDREDTGSRFGAERSSEASLVGASLAVRRGEPVVLAWAPCGCALAGNRVGGAVLCAGSSVDEPHVCPGRMRR